MIIPVKLEIPDEMRVDKTDIDLIAEMFEAMVLSVYTLGYETGFNDAVDSVPKALLLHQDPKDFKNDDPANIISPNFNKKNNNNNSRNNNNNRNNGKNNNRNNNHKKNNNKRNKQYQRNGK